MGLVEESGAGFMTSFGSSLPSQLLVCEGVQRALMIQVSTSPDFQDRCITNFVRGTCYL